MTEEEVGGPCGTCVLDRKMREGCWFENMRKEPLGRPRFKGEDNIPM